jgi:predicted nucleic-acid-binding Zn-ribbon protein
MKKSLNNIECKNSQCGYTGSFNVKKAAWYWFSIILGLFFWPFLLLLFINSNQAFCPNCEIKSNEKPIIKESKTGESKIFKITVFVFFIFLFLLFFLAAIKN